MEILMPKFKPSTYQLNVYNFIKNNYGSAVVQAVAGSGKTTTIINAINMIPKNKNVLLLAFNKSIANELKEKVPPHVRVMTYHSCAYGAYRYKVKGVQIKSDKVRMLVKDIVPDEDFHYAPIVSRLVGLAKSHALGYLTSDSDDEWMLLIDKFSLLNRRLDSDFSVDTLISYARKVYSENNKIKKVIDFDDMILFPLIFNASFFKQDFVFVDEAQDTSSVQRELLKKMLKRNGRLIAVGDSAQAIYGFRGADSNSMNRIVEDFSATTLPLSISYRCAKSIIEKAQMWNPEILPNPNAIDGHVESLKTYDIHTFRRNDAILCRNTAPLISMAFSMIARDIPVNVLGRDIGAGLVSYIQSLKCSKITDLVDMLEKDYLNKTRNLTEEKDGSKIEKLTDQKDVIMIFIKNNDDDRVSTLCSVIENFFGEDKEDNVTLCTVHKSKGHEWNRVFLLDNNLFIPKWVSQEWAIKQEENLIYVAITRAKSELYYINSGTWA